MKYGISGSPKRMAIRRLSSAQCLGIKKRGDRNGIASISGSDNPGVYSVLSMRKEQRSKMH